MPGETATRGELIELQQSATLPAPTGPDDLDFGGPVAELQRRTGGPRRVEIVVTADAPATLTNVGVAWVVDEQAEILVVPGAGEVVHASLAVGDVPRIFVVEWVARVDRLGIFAGTPGGVTFTVRVRGLYEVS